MLAVSACGNDSKSTVGASSPVVAAAIRQAVKEAGFVVSCPAAALDLGIDIGYGRRRAAAKHLKRRRDAADRKLRVKAIKFSKCAGALAKRLAATKPRVLRARTGSAPLSARPSARLCLSCPGEHGG